MAIYHCVSIENSTNARWTEKQDLATKSYQVSESNTSSQRRLSAVKQCESEWVMAQKLGEIIYMMNAMDNQPDKSSELVTSREPGWILSGVTIVNRSMFTDMHSRT
jgi:hypothetical protein